MALGPIVSTADRARLERQILEELDHAERASTVEATRLHYRTLTAYLNRLYPQDFAESAPDQKWTR